MTDPVILAIGHVGNNAIADCFSQHATVFSCQLAEHGFLRLQVVPGRQADGDHQNNTAQTKKFYFE